MPHRNRFVMVLFRHRNKAIKLRFILSNMRIFSPLLADLRLKKSLQLFGPQLPPHSFLVKHIDCSEGTFVQFLPQDKLAQTVDLIVVTGSRKRHALGSEVFSPLRIARQEKAPFFQFSCRRFKPEGLVDPGSYWTCSAPASLKILKSCKSVCPLAAFSMRI